MTPTFTFKVGGLDLSTYLRVNPEDQMDPYSTSFVEPTFTESTFGDGQTLVFQTVLNREQKWPLFLQDPSRLKDQLHRLIREINIAATKRPLEVEWRDDGASAPTFYKVNFLRFEPSFNFRRSQHSYGCGTLHIWTDGYGTTGTTRVIGTAAGTGIFLSVPIASLGGDVPALLDTTVSAGAVVPTYGRIAAVAAIGHPSYTPLIPAASLTELQGGASLIGASGAQGSQYVALPVSPTGGASGYACQVPLPNPTIVGGDNRILAVARSGIGGGVAIRAYDPYGNAIGPTAVASTQSAWSVIDLGVCHMPTIGYPTRPELALKAGGIWASGAEAPLISASPAGLALNEIICLPDRNLALTLEGRTNAAAAPIFSRDSFTRNGVLLGTNDELGNTWVAALNNANAGSVAATGANLLTNEGNPVGVSLASQAARNPGFMDADRVSQIARENMVIRGKAYWWQESLDQEEIRLFKDIAPSQYVQARFAPSQFLSIEAATGAAASAIVQACVAFALQQGQLSYNLTFQLEGPQGFVAIAPIAASRYVLAPGSLAYASLALPSSAAIPGAGAPALAIRVASAGTLNQKRPRLGAWEVTGLPTSSLQAYDAYRFDGPNADTYRTSSAGVFAAPKLVSVQRGTWPKAQPSSSSLGVVCAPFDQGTANDVISAVVSARERFYYAK